MKNKKPKLPKVRHTWNINPKTQIVPNKKRDESKKRDKVDWRKEID